MQTENLESIKEYKVVVSHTAEMLNSQVERHIADGWKPIGSHQVVESHRQNRFSGMQHKDTIIQFEYSQTLIKTK
jgi:hypothetical protein